MTIQLLRINTKHFFLFCLVMLFMGHFLPKGKRTRQSDTGVCRNTVTEMATRWETGECVERLLDTSILV